MNLRRTVLSAVAAVATGLTLSATPASAQPDTSLSGVESRAGAQAAPVCETGIGAFTQSHRFIYRAVRKTSLIRKDFTSTTAMPFRTKASAIAFAPRDNQTGVMTVNADNRARHLVFAVNRQAKKLTLVQTNVLLNRNFQQRLLASSSTNRYYTVDGVGTLRRWRLFRNAQGKLYFGDRVVVRRGLGNLKTLAFYARANFGGAAHDVLVGTTKQGALKQIRVTVGTPRATVLTLKASGFKRYHAISPSVCAVDGKPDFNHGTLVAIDNSANLAHFYTMKPFLRPAEPVIVNHGKVAPAQNWRLHATF